MIASDRTGTNEFRVRLMSPLGHYPTASFQTESAALVISPEICFSIVRVPHEDWSFSEVDIVTETELPLYGSILLAGEAGDPHLYPYPTIHSVLFKTDSVGKITDSLILESKSNLIEDIQNNATEWPTNILHKPPCLGGANYELFKSSSSDGIRLDLLHQLEIASPVILRGVSCLLRGRMAFQHPEFGEAACMFLWIALDAAHSLVLQRLRKSGVTNPSSKDAARYFEKMSGYGAEWEKFFETDYENRIQAIHPANRFGVEAIPPFLADDFLELSASLIPLYEHFVMYFPNDFPSEDETEQNSK